MFFRLRQIRAELFVGYYKQVMALYKKLGVVFVERDFSYSFSLLSTSPYSRSIATEMIYNGSSGLKGVSMPSNMRDPYIYNALGLTGRAVASAWTMGVFALWTLQLLLCYLRLLWLSIPFTRPPGIESMTYATWVRDTAPTDLLSRWTGFDIAWADFTRVILIPLFSAVCTAPEKEILEHPVEEMLGMMTALCVAITDASTRLHMANVRNTSLRRERRRTGCCVQTVGQRQTRPSFITHLLH